MSFIQRIFDRSKAFFELRPKLSLALAFSLPTILLAKIYFNGPSCKYNRDLKGKVVVVTGANAGIGYETALQLAKKGAQVVMCCRNLQRSNKAYFSIKQLSRNAKVRLVQLDLADKQSIKKCADEIKKHYEKIDILVNNAGVMGIPRLVLAKSQTELHMGTNFFGHFYLTSLLFRLILKSDQGRIVNVSSKASQRVIFQKNKKVQLDFNDINSFSCYNPMLNYSKSKLANVMFASALNRKCQEAGFHHVKSVSLHPGVVRTELFNPTMAQAGFLSKFGMKLAFPLLWLTTKNCNQGAQTTLHCCLCDYDKLLGGQYYSDCKPRQMNRFGSIIQNQNKLWQIGEQFCESTWQQWIK